MPRVGGAKRVHVAVGHRVGHRDAVAALDASRNVVHVDAPARLAGALLGDLARTVCGREEYLAARLGERRVDAVEVGPLAHPCNPKGSRTIMRTTPMTLVTSLRFLPHASTPMDETAATPRPQCSSSTSRSSDGR